MKSLATRIALAGTGALALMALTPAAFADAAPSLTGTYTQTLPDGKVLTTVVKADGSYSQSVDGKPVGSGTWTSDGSKSCFDNAADALPANCFVLGPMGADGTFTITDSSGQTQTVKKVG